MDSKLEEQRSVIKFLLYEGEKPCHIFQKLQKSFSKKHILQVAIVVQPSIQPRPCPLQLLFVSRTEKKACWNKYETRVVLISAANQCLSSRSTSWFAEGIQKLSRIWQKCIA